jgi:arabinogalactan endo-1,4-beta-galactosidase
MMDLRNKSMTSSAKNVFVLVALCLVPVFQALGGEPFWLGADVSGATMMEQRGHILYNAQGQQQEEISMMHDMGLNAVRLRIWVNPKNGWCSKEDQLTLALRAKKLKMAVMVSLHYSDTWADPGNQTIPDAWKGYDYEQMKAAVAQHTSDVLQLFHKHHIDVRWVEIGNETTHGMLWPMGNTENSMEQYAGLTQAGCKASKLVYPEAKTIIHIDGGVDPIRYNRILNAFRKYHVDYDMIGMSCYPYWDQQQNLEAEDGHTIIDCIANINGLYKKFGKETIIVETGYDADHPDNGYTFMRDFIHALRTQTEHRCHGIFYWAPEIDHGYKLGAFRNQRPTRIMDAFTEVSKSAY